MRYRFFGVAAAAVIAFWTVEATAAPKVVTSIKPLHALVAGVMKGAGDPTLLIDGAGSPHTYSMRPSEARALGSADLVVWIGPDLETFLVRPIDSLTEGAKVLEVSALKSVALLDTREGGTWEGHADHGEEGHGDHAGHDDHGHDDHGHEEHAEEKHGRDEHGHDEHAHDDRAGHQGHDDHKGHDDHAGHDDSAHGGPDMHVWLDPENGVAIVEAVVAALSEIDPGQAALYGSNGTALIAEIRASDAALRSELAAIKDRPYVVFHDAYQYFEARYGLNAVGSITVSPERAPGARRLQEIRAKIADLGATCVFTEPQFEPALVETVAEGTEARTGTLDPLGAAVQAGPGAYRAILRDLASGLTACLKPSS